RILKATEEKGDLVGLGQEEGGSKAHAHYTGSTPSEQVLDRWRWALDVKGGFKVKTLMGLIEQKIIRMGGDGQDTLWNKLVPKKVNIFVWRARKGRLPVREELNKRGIDLDSLLCALCNDSVETEAMNGVDLLQWVASMVKEEWTNEVLDLELMTDASAIGDELLNTLKL
nr:probable leucine-rich repeat receptor-like protein kinase IMK3 [Tanacetum cinerariifolium]